MPDKHFSIEITPSAEKDRERIEQYAVKLETKSQRILALSNAVLSLNKIACSALILIESVASEFAILKAGTVYFLQ